MAVGRFRCGFMFKQAYTHIRKHTHTHTNIHTITHKHKCTHHTHTHISQFFRVIRPMQKIRNLSDFASLLSDVLAKIFSLLSYIAIGVSCSK